VVHRRRHRVDRRREDDACGHLLYIEQLGKLHPAPTVKRHLAAIRHLFDYLATGGIIPFTAAAAVRGPKHSVKRGTTPVLAADEARQLLDAIDIGTIAGLRDRALIALMVYSFARVGAATSMRVEDVFTDQRRLWVRLSEKGGKRHEMPCHHNLEAYLHAYLDASGLSQEPKAPLFPTIAAGTGRGEQRLTRRAITPREAHAMVRRRAKRAGVTTTIGNHTFRGTGITAYLKNGGTLEKAREMANHADTRTTRLYDRRSEDVSLDDVERISI
jgi:site-specific recombinase XerD